MNKDASNYSKNKLLEIQIEQKDNGVASECGLARMWPCQNAALP
jgi:hypothetical protein